MRVGICVFMPVYGYPILYESINPRTPSHPHHHHVPYNQLHFFQNVEFQQSCSIFNNEEHLVTLSVGVCWFAARQ